MGVGIADIGVLSLESSLCCCSNNKEVWSINCWVVFSVRDMLVGKGPGVTAFTP